MEINCPSHKGSTVFHEVISELNTIDAADDVGSIEPTSRTVERIGELVIAIHPIKERELIIAGYVPSIKGVEEQSDPDCVQMHLIGCFVVDSN